MKIRFNSGSRLVDYIKFPDVSISVSNTPEEVREYCPDNVYLTSVEGGRITSHYGGYMFSGATNLKTFTTQLNGIMSAESMFQNCISLTGISTNLTQLRIASENTQFYNAETGTGMFKGCTNLSTADLFGLEHLSNGTMMFCSCKSLNAFTGVLNSLIYAEGMFYGCESLQSVSLGDLNAVQRCRSMFSHTGIKEFSANTESMQYSQYMFSNCASLTSCRLVMNNVSDARGMFAGCAALRTLQVGSLNTDLDVSSSPLTLSSALNIANNAVEGGHSIKFSEYTRGLSGFNKVVSILESKGWTVG